MNPTRGHSATSNPEPATSRLAFALSALVALVALSAASCTPDLTCEDIGCGPGQVCDESSGECVEREESCPETPCEEGFFCAGGECLPQSRSCDTDDDCSGDRVCSDDGVCQLPDECTQEDCTDVETCNPETGECDRKPCETQSDCPLEGFICRTDGECGTGCLVGRGGCPTGQSCREAADGGEIGGRPVGECLSKCQTDADCPCGASCSDRSNTCGEASSCDSDADCRADEICRDGKCTCPPCRTDEDCPGEQVCDPPTGVCLGGDCAEDSFAPNHTPEESAALEFREYTDLTLCPARSDWFSLEVESSAAVEFKLIHDVRRDLDLVVYDDEDRVIAADQLAPPRQSRVSGRFATRTTVISQREQTLQLRIYSTRRRDAESGDGEPVPEGADYELHVARAESASCRVEEDDNEENDTRQTAAPLPSDTGADAKFDLQICNGDLDWFVLPDVPARSQLQARLVDVPTDEDHLRLTVVAENGKQFTLGPSQALDLIRTGPEQSWYMLAFSEIGQTTPYGIRYRIDRPYDCRGAGRHGTVEEALQLPPRVETEDFLCPLETEWEVDWLELDPPAATARLEFALDPVPAGALPELDVTLFEQTSSGLERLRPAAAEGLGYDIAAEIAPSQDLFVRIRRQPRSDGTPPRPGVLELEPRYRAFYRYLQP